MSEGRALIVYHSYGGNTTSLAELVKEKLENEGYKVKMMKTKDLNRSKNYEELFNYDMLILGSNTWGDGELPEPMAKVMREIEKDENKGRLNDIVTGVFGTGETGYANYCAAVEIMRDVIRDISNLAVTIKVEQLYSKSDVARIEKFISLVSDRYNLARSENIIIEEAQ